jgi:microcystin-dependent protein
MSVNKVNKANGTITLLAGSTLWADSPIGTILSYGGENAPTGWMLCQGQAISRTTYAELFAVIGTAFGTGDGSTTFNIPDLRGEFLRGAGTNSHTNQGSGGAVGEHQDATEFPNLYGKNSSPQFGYIVTDANYAFEQITKSDAEIKTGNTKYSQITTDAFVDTTAVDRYTSRPTNTSVNYIIKIEQVALPADLEAQVDNAVEDLCTNTVTSGSTAPITSGGVYNALTTKMGVQTGGVDSAILIDIKSTADAVSDYHTFTGRTQASIEGGWFGFKKNINFWHCTFWSGGGLVIHIIYNNGTYTQKVWNDGMV